jgi:membrane-bound metal-dependent hydrolase YbcI (DUF457 family)
MFIGHYAVGFAVKRIAPRPSLGTYFAAVSFLDLLWPVLLLMGIEEVSIRPEQSPFLRLVFTSYPWSHSLLLTLVWSTLFSGIYFIFRKDRKGALWLWIGVASHWVLDAVTHVPDLPILPGWSLKAGAGLWNYPVVTVIIESFLFIGGIVLYLRSTQASDRTGTLSFWSLIAMFILSYAASIAFPPPPDATALGWGALSSFLLVAWGYWVDRHRRTMPQSAGT